MPTSTSAILIVEKDLSTLELYRRELSRHYHVFTCSEAQKALAILQEHCISAVVLEPDLRDRQGWSLLKAIKNLPTQVPIAVVLCSTLDERKRGMEMGAAAYLIKPVLPATLLEMLRQVMQRDRPTQPFDLFAK